MKRRFRSILLRKSVRYAFNKTTNTTSRITKKAKSRLLLRQHSGPIQL